MASETASFTVAFRLEFADSAGITWNLIRRTITFVDILLQKRAVKAIKDVAENNEALVALKDTVVVRSKSRVNEICNDLFRQQGNSTGAAKGTKHYCANMEATISMLELLDAPAMSSDRNSLLQSVLGEAIQSYIQNEEYPVFVENLQLTYEAPLWVSTHGLAVFLTGAIDAEMDPSAQESFSDSVLRFLSASTPTGNILDSQVVITKQRLFHGFDHEGNVLIVNPDFAATLQVYVTFLQGGPAEVDWFADGYTTTTSEEYQRNILSSFATSSETLVRDYLWNRDTFFSGVHTVQAMIVDEYPTAAPSTPDPIFAATQPPSKAAVASLTSFYKEPEGALNFTAVAVSMAALHSLIMLLSAIVVFRAHHRKISQGKDVISQRKFEHSTQRTVAVEFDDAPDTPEVECKL
ncbi:expressed unknown protein [Seminavis robusta]|uniref:Uncharacterized protein n=1 Tax=Seminavis robusta TaxID=568900 RepID=A0A9N8D8G2_9STRA|nr:expressed unknown protein [Seminavis robusta]|eukprot:Sro15_g010990.1 n/a (408) ;mRNA; r:46925-48246